MSDRQPLKTQIAERVVFPHNHDIEHMKRISVSPPLERTDHLFEWNILLVKGIAYGLASAMEELLSRIDIGKVHTQGHGIGEIPHHILPLRLATIRHYRPDDNICRPGRALKPGAQRGIDRHEFGGTLPAAERSQIGNHRSGKNTDSRSSLEQRHARARPVRGQVKHGWHAVQLTLPISQLRDVSFTLQLISLPLTEFKVRSLQTRGDHPLIFGSRRILFREFPAEQPQGPSIRNKAMNGQDAEMLPITCLKKKYPEQGRASQVKWNKYFLPNPPSDFCVKIRRRDIAQGRPRDSRDHLGRIRLIGKLAN